MALTRVLILWAVAICSTPALARYPCCHPEGDAALSIWKIVELFGRLHNNNDLASSLEHLVRSGDRTPERILQEVISVTKMIHTVSPFFERNATALIQSQIAKLLLDGEAVIGMNNILKNMESIDTHFSCYSDLHFKHHHHPHHPEVEYFFEKILSNTPDGLIYDLRWMVSYVGGQGYQSTKLFNLIQQSIDKTRYRVCDNDWTHQQEVYKLYSNILLREMRGYLMLVSGHLYLSIHRHGGRGFARGVNRESSDFEGRLHEYVNRLTAALPELPRDIRRCGPTSSQNLTSVELKSPFQGVLIDDGFTNPKCTAESTCRTPPPPGNLSLPDFNICRTSHWEKICPSESCYSDMIDCETTNRHEVMTCAAKTAITSRRYEYLELSSPLQKELPTIHYRNKTFCHTYVVSQSAHRFRENRSSPARTCSFCMCTCTNSGWMESNVRAISFLEQKTQIVGAWAITGLRFIEKDGLVHLQIKHGKVLRGGKIQEGTETWKPVGDIERRFTSKNPATPPDYYFVDNTGEVKLEEHRHYAHINKNYRTISLGDVVVPKGYLMTGVKLQYEGNPFRSGDAVPGDRIELQITATPFDFEAVKYIDTFENGDIYLTPSKSIGSDTPRKEILLEEPDVPTAAPKSEVYPGSNQIVKFRATDYKKDAGQATIPFFDPQEIETKPSRALGGVGLEFKGMTGYGGYIALKAIDLDIHDLFQPNLTLSDVTY